MSAGWRGCVAIALLVAAAGAAPAAEPRPASRVYREVGGQALRAYLFYPPDPRARERTPAILLFHGGGWSAGSAEWTFASAERFAARGLVAIAVDYRLSQGEVTPIEALSDACAAIRWVRRNASELGVDPERIAADGVSAGGQLAAMAACGGCPAEDGADGTSPSPNALLLWSPALDLGADGWFRRLLRGRGTPAAYSPAEHVSGTTPPTSIVIGELDTLTPLAGSKKYCERLNALGGRCELNVYPGVGHLLTRNLERQEADFDPHPEYRADGIARQLRFLEELGFIAGAPSPAGQGGSEPSRSHTAPGHSPLPPELQVDTGQSMRASL